MIKDSRIDSGGFYSAMSTFNLNFLAILCHECCYFKDKLPSVVPGVVALPEVP